MEKPISFGIDFIIRKSKADKRMAYIYARVTVNAERAEHSIKEQIPITNWNSQKEGHNGNTIEAKTLNTTIFNIRFRIKEKYHELLDSGTLITAETIKNAYLGVQISQRGHKLTELLDYYQKIWKAKLKQGGFKNYSTTISYLMLFLSRQFSSGDIYLSQVNMQVATDFEYFVRNNAIKAHDPCLGNGIGKHIQRFKRIINWAVEIEWLNSNPIKNSVAHSKKTKERS